MPKFTQGEWKCHPNEFDEIRISAAIYRYKICILPDYSFLSSTPQKDKEEQKANARLIAAAPEMYDLIKKSLCVSKVWNLFPELNDYARELLARIDGEECHDKTNLDC